MAEGIPDDPFDREATIREAFDGIFGDEPEAGAAHSEEAARDWLRRSLSRTNDEVVVVIRAIYAAAEKRDYARRAEIRALEEVLSK